MGDSNHYFEEKVRGRVRAEMILDENNDPVSVKSPSHDHYKVRLFLETNNPDIQSVTYKLDPTYYDPVRESSNLAEQFGIELTTYGDYPVTVDAQVGNEIVRNVVPLSKLLKETYEHSKSPEIQVALNKIDAN
jgi:hypothetical protein